MARISLHKSPPENQKDTPNAAAWLQLHIATLLFGCAGVFGKFLEVSPIWIVFGRVIFAAIILHVVVRFKRHKLKLDHARRYGVMAALGALLALHWVTFFYAIQLSSVAIGLLGFATFPIFVTLLEPLMTSARYDARDFILALAVMIGVFLVVPEFDITNKDLIGLLWGCVSGLTFALLSIMNRLYVVHTPASCVALYQNAFAAICLVPFLSLYPPPGTLSDWGMIAILGIFCTALAHSLYIQAMKQITAQRASIVVSLEPIYGIALAAIVLAEYPALRTLIGGAIIMTAALMAMRGQQKK